MEKDLLDIIMELKFLNYDLQHLRKEIEKAENQYNNILNDLRKYYDSKRGIK